MKSIHILSLILMFSAYACKPEKIDLEVSHLNPMLVVEGSFTDEFKKHQLTLSLSEDYFINRKTTRVTSASVTLTDGTTTYRYKETNSPGVYETEDAIAGTVGTTYTLDIALEEPLNGSSHYYCSSIMKPTIKIDSLRSFIYRSPYDTGDSLALVFEIFGKENPSKGDFYTSNIYVNKSYINDTIDEKLVYSDETDGIKSYVNYLYIYANGVKKGDTARLSILSVDRAYSDFVRGVTSIANYNDPYGQAGPPANALGNIQGGNALGFFMISSVSTGISIVRDE